MLVTKSNFTDGVSQEHLEQLVIMLESIGYFILDEASVQSLFARVN
jgi:hypothetical protein